MPKRPIRVSQLIAPFGPGSIYTDRQGTPLLVAGLDYWFHRLDESSGKMTRCETPGEFELFEPRLSELLGVDRFRIPPDYRFISAGQGSPENTKLFVPTQRFPRWYRNTKSGELRRFNLHSEKVERPTDGGRWQPVRFISVCAAGHLSDFPWKAWAKCECPGDGNLVLIDRGGSELSSVSVYCKSCPSNSPGSKGQTLSNTTSKPDVSAGEQSAFQRQGICCNGDRPWLGEGAEEIGCNVPLIGALINQNNIYFPRTASALALPDMSIKDDGLIKLKSVIEQDSNVGIAKTLWKNGNKKGAVTLMMSELPGYGIQADADQIERTLKSLFEPAGNIYSAEFSEPLNPESSLASFRRAEFNVIRNPLADFNRAPDLRIIATKLAPDLKRWFARVNLVERLRETRVFFGFDRLDPNNNPLSGMPDSAIRQLFRFPPVEPQDRWLPGVKVYGEGIYIELKEESLLYWQQQNADWLNERLDEAFIGRLAGVQQTIPPVSVVDRVWASRYLLVHTLAHALINQLVFECGYSTASLRERLFVSSDDAAPMAGILIYTAAGDSEGTLGGLVGLGRSERFGAIVERAISRASWCSADPICSEHLGGQGARLANHAACHACVLLPETSCETINHGLDRAMLVGTPERRDVGFFSALL